MKKKRKIWKILLLLAAILAILVLAPLALWGGDEPVIPDVDPPGRDWRTWRGYTKDYALAEDFTVTFSFFRSEQSEGCVGYAVYDASVGARIGTILLNREQSQKLGDHAGNDFRIEDMDGDGVAEIGVPLEDHTVIWYSAMIRGDEEIPMFALIAETTEE